MSLTVSGIYNYIKTYRIGAENNRYATNNTVAVGETGVQSSLIWASKGFFKAGRSDDWDDFEDKLFNSLSESNLASYSALSAILDREQLIVLEALINYALYYLYAHNEGEMVAKDKKDKAINMLGSIVGRAALDLTDLSAEDFKGQNTEAIVVSDTLDTTAIETFIGNFKVY